MQRVTKVKIKDMQKSIFFSCLTISFFSGYFFLYWLVPVPLVNTPELTGKLLTEGFSLAAKRSVGLFLMKEIIDDTYPEGMIIDQYPLPKTPIRLHQYCFVTIARNSEKVKLNFVGLKKEAAIALAEKHGFDLQIIELSASGNNEACIAAQFEKKNLKNGKREMACVSFTSNKGPFLMPDFTLQSLANLETIAAEHKWKLDLIFQNKNEQSLPSTELIIIDQRPLKSSLCVQCKALCIQFLVIQKPI